MGGPERCSKEQRLEDAAADEAAAARDEDTLSLPETLHDGPLLTPAR